MLDLIWSRKPKTVQHPVPQGRPCAHHAANASGIPCHRKLRSRTHIDSRNSAKHPDFPCPLAHAEGLEPMPRRRSIECSEITFSIFIAFQVVGGSHCCIILVSTARSARGTHCDPPEKLFYLPHILCLEKRDIGIYQESIEHLGIRVISNSHRKPETFGGPGGIQ